MAWRPPARRRSPPTPVSRVRVCGTDRCALRFLDRSPALNRRWCAMSRCGNHPKVRLHQARSRQSGGLTES
ncbi:MULTISPECIES: CGNR zinc finger domain-containing protein [unclassified Streptomyces]|uniref:CGNR zinc finger domain-containing protein n=1 Tax=unclassified Streptomyces TaxID=2593676 RepID=UPI00224E91E1|nr:MULTISPECIES: CGNR zinc finger domain-containing protein [unclassified Streptomyces]MCX5335997.1 CGNR zinc finger domain-containing protein [Streptomyces sp. NBC_00140]MCX5366717.1 CGNR zinc finger domain-containing protein [Streptomyces sp. NBC_00124]